jgi:hypothetical protein
MVAATLSGKSGSFRFQTLKLPLRRTRSGQNLADVLTWYWCGYSTLLGTGDAIDRLRTRIRWIIVGTDGLARDDAGAWNGWTSVGI